LNQIKTDLGTRKRVKLQGRWYNNATGPIGGGWSWIHICTQPAIQPLFLASTFSAQPFCVVMVTFNVNAKKWKRASK
jgi:hypothetical protein